jgi:S-adenosylmethionine decarboxylase proenzyme
MTLKKIYGDHYIVEFVGCSPEKMKRVKDVKAIFLKAARKSKANILKSYFHQYKPYGVTGIILIAESHFSFHTWPEDGYIAFDVMTCGKMYPRRAIEDIKKVFQAKKVITTVLKRGF